jgi:hypothetical protein
MKIIQIISVSTLAAMLQWSPLAAYDGPGYGYEAPDPGWYKQGSGAPRYDDSSSRSGASQDAGSGSGWYSSDWYSDQFGGDYGSARNRDTGSGWQADDWSGDAPARTDTRPGYADPGYGRDLWTQDQQPASGDYHPYQVPSRERYDTFPDSPSHRPNSDSRAQMDAVPRYDQGWRQPPARPQYRFRGDPQLDGPRVSDDRTGYQFRPLTDKELERHRESASSPRFPPRDQRRREGASRNDERGDAFGYQPEPPPRSFYERYYRAGP